uniref:Transmembrane protein n=1 Tax=Ascaris lumbricoides TaxID=6252 RepID=A0A0M3I3T4_ASCLU
MGGCPSILFHFYLVLTTYVLASSPQIESLSWYPDHDTLSNINAIIIIIALVSGLVVVIAFIILHLTRPRVEPEKMEVSAPIYPSMPLTRPLLTQNKQRDNYHQGTQLLTSKADNSDGIIMDDTQWANDETPAPRAGQKVQVRQLRGKLRGKECEANGFVGDRVDDAGNIATAVEKMQTQMPELKDLLKPANESESGASISTTKTESDRRESERLDSDRTDSSKTEGESNETNGSKDLSVSGDRDASSRSSSSRRTQTSSWGWMRSPRDVFANRPPQVNTSAFQIPSWMNVENAQSGIITDNSSGLRLGYAPPPIFAAQTLPLATPQRMPQILSPIGQHQVPPILHNPIVPVLPPIHYQQSPFIGVPFIWTPETTQPTQYSSASDSDKKEPSSETLVLNVDLASP